VRFRLSVPMRDLVLLMGPGVKTDSAPPIRLRAAILHFSKVESCNLGVVCFMGAPISISVFL